jgi:hypothetical protein
MDAIKFYATLAKIQTLADNGLRITLDLPENAVTQAAQLMELKRLGAVLGIECRVLENSERDEAVRNIE